MTNIKQEAGASFEIKIEAESDENSNTSCETIEIRPAKIPKLEITNSPIKRESENPMTESEALEMIPIEDIYNIFFGDISTGSSNEETIVIDSEVSDDDDCILVTFKCDKCPQSFNSVRALKKHKGEMEYTFVCGRGNCKRKFLTESILQEHVRGHHNTPKRFPCPTCAKKFKSQNGMENHKKDMHYNEPPHKTIVGFKKQPTIQYTVKGRNQSKVSQCTVKYTVKGRNQPKVSQCPFCNVEIEGKNAFKRHKKSHTSIKMEPKVEPKTELMKVKEEPKIFSFRGVKIERSL